MVPKMPNLFLFKSMKLIMFYQIQTKELGMILTDKKFYSIKTKCPKRIYKCIALGSTFGTISL